MNQAYTQIDPSTGVGIKGNVPNADEYGTELPDYIDISADVSLMFKGELVTLSSGDRVYKAAHKEYEYHLLTYKGLCDREAILEKSRQQAKNPDKNLNDDDNADVVEQLRAMILKQSRQIDAMQNQIDSLQNLSASKDREKSPKRRGRPSSSKGKTTSRPEKPNA